MTLDFEGLASLLRGRVHEILPEWLPGGKKAGREYECGSINGEPGKSFKVNLDTGKWCDFAEGGAGGDLISLYAAIERIDQGEAFKRLSDRYSYRAQKKPEPLPPTILPNPNLALPPLNAGLPPSFEKRPPSRYWAYRDASGRLMFYTARYDKDGKKEFRPWSWSGDNIWVAKAWPENRPLYGLELVKESELVLVVEGEKAADAARKLTSKYTVVTWMSGSKAVTKTDWRPLYGKKILLWPDADRPGIEAMEHIAQILYAHCPEIKIINVSSVRENGWDAADALAAGWNYEKFRDWAKPLIRTLKPIPVGATPLDPITLITEREVNVNLVQDDIPRNITFQALWEEAGVMTTRQGAPVVNVDSVLKLLNHIAIFKKLIWWDEFHAKIFTSWHGGTPREWRDSDEVNLAAYFQSELGLTKVTDELIRKAVFAYAERNVRHEPRDWMSSLVWDGKDRVETFFIDAMGAEDSEYTRAASKNFWISIAARIFQPGCKCDTMIILEGGQGKKKSTALEIIAGKWFAETNESPTNKDFFLAMQGKMLLEVAELDAFSKADFKTIKKVLSCKTDNYRPPFGRYTKAFPRQSVFCGSTNEDEYLDDPTGGRRFWPFRVHSIDLERISRDREQLFAEAVARFKRGESWWLMPDSAREEQEKRRNADAWETIISDWLVGKVVVEMRQIGKGALNIDDADLTRPVQLRIARVMKILNWKSKVVRESGASRRVWVREVPFSDED